MYEYQFAELNWTQEANLSVIIELAYASPVTPRVPIYINIFTNKIAVLLYSSEVLNNCSAVDEVFFKQQLQHHYIKVFDKLSIPIFLRLQ